MRFQSKIIIVTAGCSGIGGEITRYLIENGAWVIPTTRTLENGTIFKEGLKETYRNNCKPMELNLDSQENIDSFLDKVEKKYSKIDVLINCAVCREPIKEMYEWNIEEWDKHYRINVFATSYLSAKTAERLIVNNGAIINISSFYSVNVPDNRVYDEGTMPTSLIYASSKAALNYVTKYMAVLYAEKNITVNAILAGGIENKGRQTDFFVDQYCKRTPMRRMAKGSEFNAAIEFFLSDNNKYCTGQLIAIDGGWGLL